MKLVVHFFYYYSKLLFELHYSSKYNRKNDVKLGLRENLLIHFIKRKERCVINFLTVTAVTLVM